MAEKNNDLSNLQTLCKLCHARKDNKAYKLTDNQVANILHIGKEISAAKIAVLYGVSKHYVIMLQQGKWRTNITRSVGR